MFVNKKEQCEVIKFEEVDYSVYYVEPSAYEDDLILQKALKMERGRSRGSITARSRIAAINRARFLASVKRVEFTPLDSDEREVVDMDPTVYLKLSRGFRDLILERVVEPAFSPDEEDVGDFTELPTPPSTENP